MPDKPSTPPAVEQEVEQEVEETVVRLARPDDDAAACLAIYRPWIEESTVSFETEVPSIDAFAERMATLRRTGVTHMVED